jgi:hypothetical protein
MSNLICFSSNKLNTKGIIKLGKKTFAMCDYITEFSNIIMCTCMEHIYYIFESSSKSTGPKFNSWTQVRAESKPKASPVWTTHTGVNWSYLVKTCFKVIELRRNCGWITQLIELQIMFVDSLTDSIVYFGSDSNVDATIDNKIKHICF